MRLTRRQLLGAGAAAALGVRSARAGARRRGRVVVVGAGLAGLTCAHELARAGWGVTLLEARNRVGGRVYTVRSPFGAGQHAEGGGEYIDTSHRLLRSYARRFDLSLEDVRVGAEELDGVIDLEGRRRRHDAVATPSVRREIDRFRRRVEALARPLDPDDPATRGSSLDFHSAAWLLDRLGLGPTARFLVEHELRDEFTVEPENLSLLFLAQDARLNASLPESGAGAFRIRGGNDQLPLALAHELDDVRLETPVHEVELRPGGVGVSGRGPHVDADYCVLAAPLPAVRETIDVAPPLPSVLRAAIGKLQYGHATKTMLQYEQRFWRARGESGDVLTDLTFQTAWEATGRQTGRPGILLAYTAARRGILYGTVAEGARILLAADELDDVYPGTRALLEVGSSVAWHNELPSGGSYVAFAPGQVTRFWRALRRPVGRLYLAGEHTDVYTGTMEGAVRSGRRVAAAIDRRGA